MTLLMCLCRINQIKMEEIEMDKKAKPITFTIDDGLFNPTQKRGNEETVRFEIEGGGDIVTSFVRKNELEFFEFIKDFDGKNKDAKNLDSKAPSITRAPTVVRRERPRRPSFLPSPGLRPFSPAVVQEETPSNQNKGKLSVISSNTNLSSESKAVSPR